MAPWTRVLAAQSALAISVVQGGDPCCSWNNCGECGSTTDYCKSTQSACENDCNGKWCPNGAAGPSGYDMKSSCDKPSATGNAYACIDWSVGSTAMETAAKAYISRSGDESVIFGVGSFGGGKDNMGKCYKLNVQGVSKPLLVQVINQGGDVASGQFDLQVGDGGFGIFDGCASPTSQGAPAMFDVANSAFGKQYGGWQDVSGCDQLPSKPANGSVPAGEVSLPDLCRKAFSLGFKGNGNAKISGGKRVACPTELRALTGLDRTDGSDSETVGAGEVTTMMDCCKPSAGWVGNVPNADSKYPAVLPCMADGYTRVPHGGPAPSPPTPPSPPAPPSPTPTPPTPTPPSPSPTPSGCPGGSLSACMNLCPTDPTAFQACVKVCEQKCDSSIVV